MSILPERRLSRRFPIVCNVSFRTIEDHVKGQAAHGRTIELASRGLLLETETPPAPGSHIEVVIEWPARLDAQSALCLVVRGWVVRRQHSRVAVAFESYEFRTTGKGRLNLVPRETALTCRVPRRETNRPHPATRQLPLIA